MADKKPFKEYKSSRYKGRDQRENHILPGQSEGSGAGVITLSHDEPAPPWDKRMEGLVAWYQINREFKQLPTTPFKIYQATHVINPAVFYERLDAFIEAGPQGMYSRSGYLQYMMELLFRFCNPDHEHPPLEPIEYKGKE